jgi:1-acyl-sn-glycerol-3-phosphate acyltransferase
VTNEEAHQLARDKGVSRPLYALVRAVVVPFMRLWFRLGIQGAEHIPAEGGAVIAPNHKSFWDSFFISAATHRHVRFMAKTELIEARYGRLLVRLGAFPVRRGESDADALETARTVLRQGGLLALFPEGTRVRDVDALGSPRRGAGRLALEAGVPIVPAAITGTEDLFLGPLPRPRRVQVAFAEAVTLDDPAVTPEAASMLVEDLVWPQVETEYNRLRSRPGLIAAGLAAIGIGGGIVARQRLGAKPQPKLRLPGKRSQSPLEGALRNLPVRRRRKRSRLPWKR